MQKAFMCFKNNWQIFLQTETRRWIQLNFLLHSIWKILCNLGFVCVCVFMCVRVWWVAILRITPMGWKSISHLLRPVNFTPETLPQLLQTRSVITLQSRKCLRLHSRYPVCVAPGMDLKIAFSAIPYKVITLALVVCTVMLMNEKVNPNAVAQIEQTDKHCNTLPKWQTCCSKSNCLP